MARRSGAKVWICRFRDPAGKMAQLLIGSFPALSLADAHSEWRNHRATRDKHGDPRDEVRRRREAPTTAAMRGKVEIGGDDGEGPKGIRHNPGNGAESGNRP